MMVVLKFSDYLTILDASWGSSSSFSMTLPDNPSPLASNNLESSSTKYPHPGTASQPASPGSQRFERCVRRDISLVQYPCRLMMPSHRSFIKKTLQPRSARTRTSSQSNARHGPKNGQAPKQTNNPLVHEVFGRCPSRNFIR